MTCNWWKAWPLLSATGVAAVCVVYIFLVCDWIAAFDCSVVVSSVCLFFTWNDIKFTFIKLKIPWFTLLFSDSSRQKRKKHPICNSKQKTRQQKKFSKYLNFLFQNITTLQFKKKKDQIIEILCISRFFSNLLGRYHNRVVCAYKTECYLLGWIRQKPGVYSSVH